MKRSLVITSALGLSLLVVSPSLATAATPSTYVVQQGDTFYKISQHLGVLLQTLISANPSVSPDNLQIGSTLTVPGSGTSSNSGATYVVQAGDTFYLIAQHQGVSLDALMADNPSVDPNNLQVGTTLQIPAASGTSAATSTATTATTTSAAAPAPAAPTAPSIGSSVGLKMLQLGQQYLGVPYVWGGESPSGFDCSGFVAYLAQQEGVSLPHSSFLIYNYGTPVSESNLQPGDLLFFQTYQPGASHVSIYAGNGKMLEASSALGKVTYVNFLSSYFQSRFLGARRLG